MVILNDMVQGQISTIERGASVPMSVARPTSGLALAPATYKYILYKITYILSLFPAEDPSLNCS